MAWDPCVSCGREFHGSTQYNYVTWYIGQERFSYRLRHCEECSAALRVDARGNGDHRDEKGDWQLSPIQAQRKLPPEPPQLPKRSPSDQELHHRATKQLRGQNGHVA
jgi:hypothetical protein